ARVRRLRRALHRAVGLRAAAPAAHRVEQALGRLALYDRVGDRVGVLLVAIAALPDAARERDAGALLHDVRGLVGGGVQVGALAEGDVVAGRVRVGAHRVAGRRGGAALVRLHAGDVVATERHLDRVEVRQGATAAGRAARRGRVHVGAAAGTVH